MAASSMWRASTPDFKVPSDITKDGRFLLFHSPDQNNDPSIWLLPLSGDRQASRLLPGSHGRVSPNGRWLAYTSNETGMRQVYVTTFPAPTQRWRVSTDRGGEDPQWRADGRELYYVEQEQTLTAVPVGSGGGFQPGTPDPLFRVSFPARDLVFGSVYAPAPDGQRFLVNEQVRDSESSLWVTLNWTPKR